ncbi:MAG: hypothetical protein KDH20_09395 [Rhodocyclaceae bacterium]|nr:hypothetical protein [Rhodocyclaceae bacterium]
MPTPRDNPSAVPGYRLAVACEALYLINLMIAPGLAFLVLVVLWFRHQRSAPPLARCHLAQTLSASLWAGALLVAANGLIVAIGGYDAPGTWVVVVLYFTACHSTLIFFGAVGLSRAMAGETWRFPLVGRPCDER